MSVLVRCLSYGGVHYERVDCNLDVINCTIMYIPLYYNFFVLKLLAIYYKTKVIVIRTSLSSCYH